MFSALPLKADIGRVSHVGNWQQTSTRSRPKGQEVRPGRLCNSPLTAAFLARRRIDFAARLHWLHHHGIAGPVACRTFRLGRLLGWLSHLRLSGRLSWRPSFVPSREQTTSQGFLRSSTFERSDKDCPSRWLTLRDAATYITALPKAEHDAEEWQTAMETLLLVAEQDGPAMMARIGMMRALDRHSAKATPAPRRKRAKAYRVIR